MTKIKDESITEWESWYLPVFDDESVEAVASGFVEVDTEKSLCWSKGDFLIVRQNVDRGNKGSKAGRIYHAYKKVLNREQAGIDADGNPVYEMIFIGNLTYVQKVNGPVNRNKKTGKDEPSKEPKGYSSLKAAIKDCVISGLPIDSV